jgi:hypothetical protein
MSNKFLLILTSILISLALVSCGRGEAPPPGPPQEMMPLEPPPPGQQQSSPVTDVRVYFPGNQPSFTYNGQCPTTITFVGDITVDGPCTVTYRWVRSDGVQGPVETEVFNAAGAIQLSDTWTLGAAGWSSTQWERIDILTPLPRQSNEATFTLNCNP